MKQGVTVKRQIKIRAGKRGKKSIPAISMAIGTESSVPRITRLMALALQCDQLLSDGIVKDQAELARIVHVSRPRLTQILNLVTLAPDIQEQLLFHSIRLGRSRHESSERHLRIIVAVYNWNLQRDMWNSRLPEVP